MSDILETRTRLQAPTWTLQDRLIKARSVAGLSQRRMSELVGCSSRTILRYETPGSTVPPVVLLAYHMACAVDLGWLSSGLASWEGGKSAWPSGAQWGAEGEARPEGLEPPTFWSGSAGRQYCTLDIDLAFWMLVK
jgi:DNA-binding XRE family transcriptional regulator